STPSNSAAGGLKLRDGSYISGAGRAMLAYDYPLGGVLLSMLYFFLFFIWIWLLITVFVDIFRSHDLSGWSKALWSIFVIILPFLGVFIYLIARGGKCRNPRSKTLLSRSCPSTLRSER